MEKKINIAIDGHSSCGKSTLAKEIAKKLGYKYIDSGAMYRAVALYCLQNNIKVSDTDSLSTALNKIDIDLVSKDGQFLIYLEGQDVTDRIKAMDVSSIVSEFAAVSIVRKKLVDIQREHGNKKGVVMDGRDIGTVVFPSAEVKLFVTADPDIRAQRRFLELKEKNMEQALDTVKANLIHRDKIDSTREDSPLIQAKDAILIDNSYMTRDEQLYISMKLIQEKLEK